MKLNFTEKTMIERKCELIHIIILNEELNITLHEGTRKQQSKNSKGDYHVKAFSLFHRITQLMI
jgi:hypothetical protein